MRALERWFVSTAGHTMATQSSLIAMETAYNLMGSQSRVTDHDSSRRIIIFARELGFSLWVGGWTALKLPVEVVGWTVVTGFSGLDKYRPEPPIP